MPELMYADDARFSCVQCGACCRDLRIPLTPDDYQRHSAVSWQEQLEHKTARLFEQKRERHGHVWYFAQRPGHGCVFLRADGRCQVHAARGYECKALACKLFPFKFIPAPDGIRVALKFHCPAVIANLGEPLSRQHKQLTKLFADYCRDIDFQPPATVPFFRDYAIPWPAFAELEAVLFTAIGIQDLPLHQRLLLCLRFVHACKQNALGHGKQGDFAVELDPQALLAQLLQEKPDKVRPGLGERVVLTQFLGYLVGHQEHPAWWRAPAVRIGKLGLAFGRGSLRLRGFERPVALNGLVAETPWQTDAEGEVLLLHYFRSKLLTRDYFGPSCHHLPLVSGLTLLVTMYPLITLLARLYASSRGHRTVTGEDIKEAIYMADFASYASDVFAGMAGRVSSFMLGSPSLVEKLVFYYGS